MEEEEDYKKQILKLIRARDEKAQLAADQAVKIQQLEQHLKKARQIADLQAQEVRWLCVQSDLNKHVIDLKHCFCEEFFASLFWDLLK